MGIRIGLNTLEKLPESLSELFDENPKLREANEIFASTEHIRLGRNNVLFIKQRQQATSDYRENKKVRWIGSHAAMTCHIAIMRHVITGVTSIGHFDNFCCWQFGDESSAHKEGISIMLEEIAALSRGYVDDGRVEVSVVGGYSDVRGDAAKNSLSLLKAIYEVEPLLELVHYCVGPYNTTIDKNGNSTAILKGVAIDLKTQVLFPALFEWGQYTDFKSQIEDRFAKRIGGRGLEDVQDRYLTKESTFKPKSLKNSANRQKLNDYLQNEKKKK